MMLEGMGCPEGMTNHILHEFGSLNAYRMIQGSQGLAGPKTVT